MPAYDEEANIGGLLESIEPALAPLRISYRIVVVDDGSTDGTATVLAAKRATIPQLEVVTHAPNQGLGSSIRDGLLRAASQARPDDVVVSMDADETHAPALIPAMLERIDAGSDVVVASRYLPGSRVVGLAKHREWLSVGASWLLRGAFPTPGLRDYTSGYRAYRAGALQRAIAIYGAGLFDQHGFQCMVDIVLKMRRLPVGFAEVPLVLRYDLKKGASKMRVVPTVAATLRLLVRRRFEAGPRG